MDTAEHTKQRLATPPHMDTAEHTKQRLATPPHMDTAEHTKQRLTTPPHKDAADHATGKQRLTTPPAMAVVLMGTIVCHAVNAVWRDTSPPLTLEEAGTAVDGLPPRMLAVSRGVTALVHAACLACYALGPGVTIVTKHYKRNLGSHLRVETLELRGVERCSSFFTIWTYTAQGAYFALAAWCSAAAAGACAPPGARALALTHALFELSTGCSLLVTVMVTFVIWPTLLRDGHSGLIPTLGDYLMHNFNVLETFGELLYGRVPMRLAHLSFPVLWGAAYVCWTWVQAPALARRAKVSRGNGANFMYFFLDYTLPPALYVAFLTALLGVLLAFYAGAMGIQAVINALAAQGMSRGSLAVLAYGCGFSLTKWHDKF